ncbi:hypothetical protein AVEN_18217-1 [Araneus ventricosus]|uniref:Uncharacterized protein n=1 Tax=Araneus ventricosus TaxID=182803 RepID=A0A4Y2AJ72_ARAVE|nr:hypothetical protein AVEN_18217-1 [Araneus ventricosus]
MIFHDPNVKARFNYDSKQYSYQKHPGLVRIRPMHLNDSRCDSSSAEAGVLMTIADHGPTPPVGGTHNHRQSASPKHYCTMYPSGKRDPVSHPRTRSAPNGPIVGNM